MFVEEEVVPGTHNLAMKCPFNAGEWHDLGDVLEIRRPKGSGRSLYEIYKVRVTDDDSIQLSFKGCTDPITYTAGGVVMYYVLLYHRDASVVDDGSWYKNFRGCRYGLYNNPGGDWEEEVEDG